MNNRLKHLSLIAIVLLFSSCGINPNIMFQVPKDYEYANDQTIGNVEYRIVPNDIIAFSIYTNDGFKLIDLTTSAVSVNNPITGGGGSGMNNQTMFLVEPDGQIKLPIIGKFKIAGYTVREAEKQLEAQYATYYNKPFVIVRVTNRRVLVFPGNNGIGRVVPLENENTTLIEALAMAGGLTNVGKAYKIKLIRGDLRNPKVMLVDLSTVKGMTQSNLYFRPMILFTLSQFPEYLRKCFSRLHHSSASSPRLH